MTAWYDLPIINQFGQFPDSVGNYPVPDINIVATPSTQFTAPASGVITGINPIAAFGKSITVKFDSAPNNVAQYYAFNYLSSIPAGLNVGQHINAGELLGVGGSNPYGNAAFAFSAGPVYGQGTGWADNVVGTWINPSLNPTGFINSLKSGGTPTTQGSSNLTSSGTTASILPQFPNLYQILGLPSQTDMVNFFQRSAIVSVGLMIILVGIIVLFFSSKAGKETINVGEEAAKAGAVA